MKLTSKSLSENPAFANALKEMEPVIKQVILDFFKLPQDQKNQWRLKLNTMAEKIRSGEMKPTDLPKDIAEKLGIQSAMRDKLLQAGSTFVTSLNLKKDDIRINKKRLEGEFQKATEIIGYGEKLATKIVAKMDPPPFNDNYNQQDDVPDQNNKDCMKDCLRIFLTNLALSIGVFIAALLVCLIIAIVTFGIGAGPCIGVAVALLISGIAVAIAKFQKCKDACKGLA